MSEKNTTIVYMADDDRPKCGFCDRMRAIIWLYSFCKKHDFSFKINFTYPFNLQEYLKPNSYDWTYNEKEDTIHKSIKIAALPADLKKYYDPDILFYENVSVKEIEALFLKYAQSYAKILVYSNYCRSENFRDYGKLFDELFCFSTELNETLQFHIKQMNSQYVAVHFRFQLLLNDIASERNISSLPVLHTNEQNELCLACVKVIQNIHRSNHRCKVLVCSDSTNFIKFIKNLNYDYTYLIEGERKHIDAKGLGREHVLLCLLDYFLLVFAKKNYSVIKGNMYPSTFPFYASLHYKIPFVVLDYRIPVMLRIIRKIKNQVKKGLRFLKYSFIKNEKRGREIEN
jgi:hypothetical protein